MQERILKMQGTFTTIRWSLNISIEQMECMSFMLLVYRTKYLVSIFREKKHINETLCTKGDPHFEQHRFALFVKYEYIA